MTSHGSICERAARAGGRVLLEYRGRFAIREKASRDLVTDADLAAQEAIFKILSAESPGYGIVGEEADSSLPPCDFCWWVDPLDGTMNYAHGFPHYAVSIGLTEHGQVIAGTVYDPVRDECFLAERGQGATLNGRQIRTSGATKLSQAMVAANFSAHVESGSVEIAQFVAALLNSQSVRRTGSAALNLAYVAAGRIDAFWALATKPWDVAAGVLLVTEAGGSVTAMDGSTFELKEPFPLAAASGELLREVAGLLDRCRPTKSP